MIITFHTTTETKTRPDVWITRAGVGPSAQGALCGNTLHGEVNGDSENQTRTAFVHFFSSRAHFFSTSPSTFHRVLAAFPELQWAGLSGYVFTCRPLLPSLLSAGDPCSCDLLFHSCLGRKGETSRLAAAHMDYEHSGMHTQKIDLALKPHLCPISIPLLQYYQHSLCCSVYLVSFFPPHKTKCISDIGGNYFVPVCLLFHFFGGFFLYLFQTY